jgi:glycosyltransferase involved in cell wall biosynthesis
MNNQQVDIALSCFNAEKFLEECISTIVSQTFTNWKIILVDDCSTDNTMKVLDEIIEKFNIQDKITIIKHEKNWGYGKTLRDAIENGSNELIFVIDSDDGLSDKDAIKIMIEEHQKHPEASLIYSNYWFCHKTLFPHMEVKCKPLKKGKAFLRNPDAKISHLKCFKRSYYNKTEGLDGTLLKAVDKDLILKLEEVGKLVHIDIPLYLHRKHADSISGSYKNKPVEYQKMVFQKKLDMYNKAEERRRKK